LGLEPKQKSKALLRIPQGLRVCLILLFLRRNFKGHMANLKEVRIRLASVNTTQQITKAMKLVAASKLKRAQDRILQMRP